MFSNKNVKSEILNKENLLKYVSEYDIYNYYVPGIKIGKKTNSPLRAKDKDPSFGIFIGKYGDLAFNDYKLGGGDCFTFVSQMEHISYYGAMCFINELFDINLLALQTVDKGIKRLKPKITNYKPTPKKKPKISIKVRDWNQHDIDYFSPLDVNQLKMIPIKYFWIDDQLFNTDTLAYAYRYGPNVYKIYQPNLTTKTGKWWSNISVENQWFGHELLPDIGDLLFVCSSNKDASVLHQLGYNAIAPHTEAQIFSSSQYSEYKNRFKRIIVFYDNDETGIKKAEKFSNCYNLEYIYLEEADTKDPFEFVKTYSLVELDLWLKEFV